MTQPAYWSKAAAALSKKDPTLKKLITAYKGEMLTTRGDLFYTLARSITGQQISVKAADSVWRKLVAALPELTPQALLSLSDDELRACGLSHQKVRYLKHFSEFMAHPEQSHLRWHELPDEALIKEMIALNGVGRWTAEMMLIFHYMRPDIFPVADLGVLNAIYRHYNKGEKMTKAEVLALAEEWRPWRTVATWYLWRALDPQPVEY